MNRRELILAELGLMPLWRRRERLEQAQTDPGAAPQDSTAGHATDPNSRGARKAGVMDTGTVDTRSIGTGVIETGVIETVAVADVREPLPAGSAAVHGMDWAALGEAVAACTACTLHRKRKQAVLGVGDKQADWLIVGEGPGAEEDARGEPFVGAAGKLLDNMLRAIGLKRGNNVYIANVVKCRPPGNRTPSVEEAEACAPFLDRQIELLHPRLIVALGKVAAHRLLGLDGTLGSMRKTVHDYRGIPLIVTYHPAYLLRSLTDKAKAWEDLRFAVDTMSDLLQREGGQG